MISKGPTVIEVKQLFNVHPQQAWIDLVLKYGKNFWYRGTLLTCDPKLVETLLTEKKHTQKRSLLYTKAKALPGADGILFQEGDRWQQSARIVMPVFSKDNINRFPKLIEQITLTYAAKWETADKLEDLFAALMELGADIFLEIGCNLDPKEETTHKLSQALIGYKAQTMSSNSKTRLDELGLDATKLLDILPFIRWLFELRGRVSDLRKLVQSILKKRESVPVIETDWLNNLQKSGLSLNEITNHINHLYGAFNAIDFSLTCAFYVLSHQPDWIKRLRSEFDLVMEENACPTRVGAASPKETRFPSLVQTTYFMREVFRMYPVAMAVMRQTGEAIELDGEVIPAGTEVMILLYALHHHPDFWENPETFDPDRWTNLQSPRVPYSYIPFLDGPRQCLGRHWAELNFVTILHTLLQHYEIEILKPTVPITRFLIPRFAEAMPCRISKRYE
ncbi:cytochrome P450 [Merismopedia glauca]|uniref:Cytochrome P450 n=1 Tax=Merismopedia glauca CCAP 1448/3 TaxID=1296344 RepID=A0A2T1C075_9CYAN|nr:cytochrome P450 [Merismopedia glauca]PSB01523.1 hypothetical protein C7B64_17830 [Merismopedia glauca CCAP 1448/3]